MSEQKPRAWLQEPKVQPIAGRHFVRGVRTVEPTADEYEFAALDGDVLLPLYDAAALAAAVAAERERCALLCDALDNPQNSGDYRSAAYWAAFRIRAQEDLT